MVVNVLFEVDDTEYSDFKNLKVDVNSGDNNASSHFKAVFDSPFGRHKTDFVVGKEVTISADSDTQISPGTAPKGHYKLNDNATTTNVIDSSGNGHDGTAHDDTNEITSSGKIDKSFLFDGGGGTNVDLASPTDFDNIWDGGGTVAAWINPITDGEGSFGRILDKEQWRVLVLDESGSFLKVQFHITFSGGARSWRLASASVPLSDWTHVAVVYNSDSDSNEPLIYINGEVQALTQGNNNSGTRTSDAGDNLFISNNAALNRNFFGKIDDVRIYDSTLTATEVLALYNGGNGTENTTNSTQIIFKGILEEVQFRGRENTQEVILSGKDFTTRLMDATIEPIVFTDSEASTIVTNLITNEVDDITTNNVNVTAVTIPRISFHQKSVFEALKQLSELTGFLFYVDTDKDLHFEQKSATSSGFTFDNTNIVRSRSDATREGMVNKAWVYGDRQLAGKKEVLSADGGSVFTLLSKPHNTEIESSDFPGSVLQGGVFQFGAATSGQDYLVSFDDKQLIFVSGTEIGYTSVPTSGGSIIARYDRSIPIVKFGIKRGSIEAFGPRELVIQDKTIKDPRTAIDRVKKALTFDQPIQKTEVDLKGWFNITVGQTAIVTLSDFNLNNTVVPILSAKYIFDANTVNSEQVIRLRLDTKIIDFTDQMTSIEERLRDLESQDIETGDLLTRLEQGLGSFLIVGSIWEVSKRWNGSGFILGGSNISRPSGLEVDHPGLGRLGSTVGGSASFLGLGGVTAYVTQTSGGFDYS